MLQKIIKSLKKDKKFMAILSACHAEFIKTDGNVDLSTMVARDTATLSTSVCHYIVSTLLEEKVKKPKKKKK